MFSPGETVTDTDGTKWTVFEQRHVYDIQKHELRKIILAFNADGDVKAFESEQISGGQGVETKKQG